MPTLEFEVLPRDQQLFEVLKSVDETPVGARFFERFTYGQQLWQIYNALEGTQGQRFFERMTEGQQLYKIYALLNEAAIPQRRFESLTSDVQWFLIYTSRGEDHIGREHFLSLTRGQQLYLVSMTIGVDPLLFRLMVTEDATPEGMTFSRASLATLIDENGLVRNAPHNLFLQSNDLSHATDWLTHNGPTKISSNSAVAPDGSLTASIISFVGAASSDAALYQNRPNAGGRYTVSGWVRAQSGTQVFRLAFADGGGLQASADLVATTAWQKFSWTYESASITNTSIRTDSANSATGPLETWGFQLEKNISASEEYLPTTDVIRFDSLRTRHYEIDPITDLRVRTMLLEPQRTNLLLHSQEFDNAAWTKQGATVTANNVTAPDGTLTADRLVVGTGALGVYQLFSATVDAGSKWTISVWLRADATAQTKIGFNGASNGTNNIFTTVAVTAQWQRFSFTITANADAGLYAFVTYASGVADHTVYAWGAQCELGSFPTSYIRTEGSTVTRAADYLRVVPAGFAPSPFTVFARGFFGGRANLTNARLFNIGDDGSGLIAYQDSGGSLVGGTWGTPKFFNIMPVPGAMTDQQELLLSYPHNGGPMTRAVSVNGGADSVDSSDVSDVLASFLNDAIYIATNGANNAVASASFRDFVIAKGIRDLAFFRALVNENEPPIETLFRYDAGDSLAGATFSRASAATYVDGNGFVRTAGFNLALHSEDWTNAVWVNAGANVIASNAAIAPSGALTADRITHGSGGDRPIYQAVNLSASATYTYSVYLKGPVGAQIYLTLEAGAVTKRLVTFTGEWQREEVTATGGGVAYFYTNTSGRDGTFLPEVTYDIWGAQLETASTASPYSQTTSAPDGIPRDAHYIDGVRTTLLEPQRTNVIVRSDDITWPGTWIPNNSTVTASATLGPDGTPCERIESLNGGSGGVYQGTAAYAFTGAYTFSVFLKAGTVDRGFVRTISDPALAVFDLTAGTVITTPPGHSANIEALADGWFRCSVSGTIGATLDWNAYLGVEPAAPTPGASVFATMAQLEAGATPSSYIPTVASTVTRAADLLYLANPPTPQVMTVYARVFNLGASGANNAVPIVQLGSNADPRFLVGYQSGTQLLSYHNSSYTGVLDGPDDGDSMEIIATLGQNGVARQTVSYNGGAEVTATPSDGALTGTAWSTNEVRLGTHVGSPTGLFAYRNVLIVKGKRTLAEMRSLL